MVNHWGPSGKDCLRLLLQDRASYNGNGGMVKAIKTSFTHAFLVA